VHVELIRVVSVLVAIFAKLDFVNVFGNDRVVFSLIHSLHLQLDSIFHFLFALFRRYLYQLRFKFFLCSIHDLRICLGRSLLAGGASISRLGALRPVKTTTATPATPTTAIALLSFLTALLETEEVLLILSDICEKHITVAEVDLALVSKVTIQTRQRVLVHSHDRIKSSLSDLQRWQMRQEIVSNEEAQEYKVIDQTLEVEFERQLQILEL